MSLSYLRYIDHIFIIWNGKKEQLITFINELNKNKTIKFGYKISSQKMLLINTILYKDKKNNLQTTLYLKPTDQQSYLHAKSEHSSALKNSISYTQTLRLRTICFAENDYQRNCADMKQKPLEKKYNEDNLNKQMEKVDLIERKELLQNNEKSNSKKNITLVLTYNRTLPNIPEIV